MVLHLRKWGLLLLLLLLLAVIVPPAQAADSGITIRTEAGFDGKVKNGRGFPVKVTVENNGDDFKGDLLLNFYPTYSSSGSKVIHVDVPKGGKKTYNVSLPGISDDGMYNAPNMQAIFLYEGGWKDGKETSFRGAKKLSLKYVDPSWKTLGLLSKDPDRLKELKSLPGAANTNSLVIEPDFLPEDKTGLDNLDVLAIDGFPLSSLTEAQQQAILSWAKDGGVLIVGGAADAQQAYGSLFNELPMQALDETKADLTKLESAVKPDGNFAEVPAFHGALAEEADVVIKSGSIPLVVNKEFGSGEIWQTAFSLGDNPVAAWKGYGEWFSTTILKHSTPFGFTSYKGYTNPHDQYYNEFAETNEYFPSVHFTIGQITLMLLIYVLLAAPILYLLLKRYDKREHAWWIVPAFALFISAVIFGIGAKDRIAKSQVNQMAVLKAEGGVLQGVEAVTLLSNTSGDYKLEFPSGEFNAIPGSFSMQQSVPQRYAVLEEGRNKDSYTFPNVEYWSTRTVYGTVTKEEDGHFAANLQYDGKKVEGTIVNNFPHDFDHMYVWSGSKRMELGPLKKGDTLEVDKEIAQGFMSGPLTPANSGYYNPQSNTDIEKMKKEKLEYGAIEYLYNQGQTKNLPIIYGLTKQPVRKVDIAGKSETFNHMTLIYQLVDIEGKINGPFTLKEDVLTKRLVPIKGEIHEEMPGAKEIVVADGTYDYSLTLPKQLATKTISLKELSITWYPNSLTWSIFDRTKNEFEVLKDMTTRLTDNPSKYISDKGEIILRLEKNGQQDPMVRMPSITVKGEAGK
ncbi:hypothetical protein A8F94_11325 [Bacillus sp. FJAT-27225]|uniref:hypothetical protein n=1 Tax=Bacillus sp. FJAT-27225 TaxID=1743144 RepID=UPI00080C2EAE|nr:hypothetical protein [Bacillus sp. FJAT-27225]OCA85475.1 hypothetical protein A8F94_11325 [Bacillus sp. FJAT-27225]